MAYIIMKYDDLTVENLTAFARVADFSIQGGYPISMGLVGQSLAQDNMSYKNKLKEWSQTGIEIWNHGYAHTMEEFSSASYEQQCQSLVNTQRLMKSELGESAVTFGSPHNNSTETTIRALKDVAPEIRNYLFAVDGTSISDARQMLVRCDMEITTGNIDFDFFKKNYEALKDFPYMVIQGHPSFWSKQDLEQNEKVMVYLRNKGNIFVTPCNLPYCGVMEALENKEYDEAGELLDFAAAHEKIALYGAGEIGRELYRFLKSKAISPDMFIVSDGQEIHEKEICTIPVVHLSEFSELGSGYGIIVAMMPKFHREIECMLQQKNADYFCFHDHERYMGLVHYVRMQIF